MKKTQPGQQNSGEYKMITGAIFVFLGVIGVWWMVIQQPKTAPVEPITAPTESATATQ
jgi:hypothetical protein